MKYSQAAIDAKIDFMQKHFSAKKIQRAYRNYLVRRAQIEEEMAHEAQMTFFHAKAAKI